ncbi:ABC transporter permease [Salinisphaera sp. SPP-AMP-43]|uniref:ABC transporter permease n=1 Tax=Salinisphaera sp. SPP-AMP-43 TaxID=3121288 RepID=UPI003C6E1633
MRAANIVHLAVKELRGFARDPVLLVLIVYAFTLAIYAAAQAIPDALHDAPIAIVDEDDSPLSRRIVDAFQPPYFLRPRLIGIAEMDARLDAGRDTFALDIPPHFQRDVLAGRRPAIQVNVDATRISQAFTGSGYIQTIIDDTVRDFVQRRERDPRALVGLVTRVRFNPQLNQAWFGAIVELIDNITLLSIVLTGAALIREREHGTVEHLLVMPVTPIEIMLSKVGAMALVVLAATAGSLMWVLQSLLGVPIQGSIALFLAATVLHLFATTSMGIFLGTLAPSMPQFGLLVVLVLLPLQILSGGTTPRESMPLVVRDLMLAAPTTHFMALAQSVLFRGAGLATVWPQLVAIAAIGSVLFLISLAQFRRTMARAGRD